MQNSAGFQKEDNTLNTPTTIQIPMTTPIDTRDAIKKATIAPIETPPMPIEATNAALAATSLWVMPFIYRHNELIR